MGGNCDVRVSSVHQKAKIFAQRVRCCVRVSGCVVVKNETDPQHQPMPITAISHQPVVISDYQSKITAAAGAVLKTHGKKPAQPAPTEFVQNHQAGGQILERLSLQRYLSVCVSLSASLGTASE